MRYFTLALLWGLSFIGGAYAQNMPPATQFDACVTGIDTTFATQGFGRLRCDVNGNLLITGISGGGGGGGNAAVTSNATDGQATSTTNQQNVTYGYIFNGSTWDRMRGTGGALNVAITGTLPAFAATPTFNVGTTNGLALDATVTARLGTLGQKTSAGSAPVVLSSDQPGIPITNITGTVSLPTGAANATNQATEIASLAAIQQRAVTFAEQSGGSVAASGTATGASRDAGANPLYSKFNSVISSNQNGTLFLQGSNDNFTTLVGVASVAVTANVPAYITVPVMFRYNRYVFGNANSTTAATVSINSSYTAN